MLKIEGKTFMNIQEAVQWLLDNNCIPFQCEADYQAYTEIGLGTIVNPTPAKVRIGSLIFFADSKVSTVVGITENGFICSDKYNDLVDDLVYVSNVALNASGHLIVTLSNGDNIDAGLIKQVSSFSINASQHLIVNYNDGTNTDLGAIFNGNVNIAGNFTADSIIENMSGYSFTKQVGLNWENIFTGVVKNGNKITFVIFGKYTYATGNTAGQLGYFNIPSAVGQNLYPYTVDAIDKILSQKSLDFFSDLSVDSAPLTAIGEVQKGADTYLTVNLRGLNSAGFVNGNNYLFRIEVTFLLSENLAS